jgi:ribosomal protein S17
MKINFLIAVFFSLILNNVVLAETDLPGASETVVASAKLEVVEIDHEKRTVKLKNANGDIEQIDVASDVRNFDQVKVGDFVNIDYAESVTIQAFNADDVAAGAVADAAFARAEEGQKPGAAAVENVTLVATISAIDLENQTVTLQGKEGNTKTIKAQNPENLKKVKVGDKVMFSFTRALMISVVGK